MIKNQEIDYKFIILLFSVLFLVFNILTLKDGQNWCSDFGQYLTQAQNILEHKEYSRTYYVGWSVATPPGYPLILAPLIKVFGLNLKILKVLNVVFLLGAILLLYLIMQRRLGREDALLGAMLLFTSPDFFILFATGKIGSFVIRAKDFL